MQLGQAEKAPGFEPPEMQKIGPPHQWRDTMLLRVQSLLPQPGLSIFSMSLLPSLPQATSPLLAQITATKITLQLTEGDWEGPLLPAHQSRVIRGPRAGCDPSEGGS